MHRAPRIAAQAAALLFAVAVALLARPATAAELAILRNGFTIRHDHRLMMGTTTRLYLAADDSNFTDVPTEEITGYEKDLSLPVPVPVPPPANARASIAAPSAPAKSEFAKSGFAKSGPAKSAPAPPLNEVVNIASAAYHLDPDLVNSVIHAESGFNAHAVSPKGARGLMQLMPGTASQLGVNDSFDPQANVTGGSRYLRELLERYDFDLVKALAAYNAGPDRVEQYRGVPPFRETRAYVARIVHEYNTKKTAQEKAAKQKAASARAPSKAPNKAANKAPSKTPSRAQGAPKPAGTTVAVESPR
ncbi:MAG: lytic transglycosylase domain-containing protein [Terriglobales bacterium]|jgi:soluble lytic murein transglycosylase-like protein